MNGNLSFADGLVFFIYFIVVALYGYWIYHKKKRSATNDTKSFFFSGRFAYLVGYWRFADCFQYIGRALYWHEW